MLLNEGESIAIVGAGVAGIAAAHYLQNKYRVTLYEKEKRIGGHTNTIAVNDPDCGTIGIDTGFIVLNDQTYPRLHSFLNDLGVAVRSSDMSFSVVCQESGIAYGSKNLSALFGQARNVYNPAYYRMLFDFPKFWRDGTAFLSGATDDQISMGSFCEKNGYSSAFIKNFIVPMGAAIWSSPDSNILNFPAKFYLYFFRNHGMLSFSNQPQWQTVQGGSWSYLKSFEKRFNGEIINEARIVAIDRRDDYVEIRSEDGTSTQYAGVVMACHADQALQLLMAPSTRERALLGAFSYQQNRAVLHSDERFLPPIRRVQSSWNYLRSKNSSINREVCITYDMNRLQGLTCRKRYCVTLNPCETMMPTNIIYDTMYSHPQYRLDSEQAQTQLATLQGEQRTYFCGSYFGFGFHEDACKSGYNVAQIIQGL